MSDTSDQSNPYVGLRPFDHADSLYFFGRRTQVADLLQQLHETRFLAVVGSSGCGKSSLIRAGLIPALLGGFLVEERDRWLVAKLRPGGGPIANFAHALCQLVDSEPTPEEVSKLQTSIADDHLEAVVDYLKPRLGRDANLLILLDQFEEIFAYRGSESDDVLATLGREERLEHARRQREAADFVDLALELASQTELPVYVVLTMRSDFLGDCDLFYGLPEAMNLSRYLVPRLNRGQLREAIEGPAMLLGQRIAPRLVDALLNELGDRHDRLPILQHALMRSYDFWAHTDRPGAIDLEHYEAAGGLQDALPRHANEALGDDVDCVARIFKCLTDTDPNHRRVRRRASLRELVAVSGGEPAEIEAILRRFNEDGRNFLWLSTPTEGEDHQVEISHESLIRQWNQLADWVDEEREARDQFRELVDRARRQRALLRDPDLQIALNWRDAMQPTAAWAQRHSADRDDLPIALEYLDRSHQAKIETERRRRFRRNLELSATLIVGLLLSGLSLWALDNAAGARDIAYIAIASDWMQRDPTMAALVIAEVQQPERSQFAAPTMLALLQKPIAQAVLSGHEGRVEVVAFSPDGTRVVTASSDMTARVWYSDGTGPIVVLRGHEDWVRFASFSPDGQQVVTASDDGTARIWSADGSGTPIVLRGHEGAVATASFDSDGRRVVTASNDETARVWRTDGQGEPVVLAGHWGPVATAVFSQDGTKVLTSSEDGTARIFSADGGEELIVLEGHEGSVAVASFSSDERRVVTASADGSATVWNADGSGKPVVLGRRGSLVSWLESAEFSPDDSQVLTVRSNTGQGDFESVHIWDSEGVEEPIGVKSPSGRLGERTSASIAAFSPGGASIAIGLANGDAHLIDLDGEAEPINLLGHTGTILAIVFSLDGTQLATGSDDGTARIWRIDASAEPTVLAGHDDWVASALFSPDGRRVLTASHDGSAVLWDLAADAEPVYLEHHDDSITSAAFSPDGRHVVTGSTDETAAIWQLEDTQEPYVLEGHDGPIIAVAYSPDGSRILTASDDGDVRIWPSTGKGQAIVLDGHQGSITTAAWSPDGNQIATGSIDKTVRIWNADGGGEPVVLRGHEQLLTSVAFSPDGSRILTSSGDETARVWNADGSGDPIVLEHGSWISSAEFSPDGKWIVTASDDRAARIWNADGSGEPVVLLGHDAQVGSAAFSRDGRYVVTTSVDRTARVWRLGSRGEPTVLSGHDERLTGAAFSHDGSRILTWSTDGTARVWAYTPELLQNAIVSMTSSCLEPSFRVDYLNESEREARGNFEQCEERLGR